MKTDYHGPLYLGGAIGTFAVSAIKLIGLFVLLPLTIAGGDLPDHFIYINAFLPVFLLLPILGILLLLYGVGSLAGSRLSRAAVILTIVAILGWVSIFLLPRQHVQMFGWGSDILFLVAVALAAAQAARIM